jgi:hypothetical protein
MHAGDGWNLTVAVLSYFGFGTHQTLRFIAFVYALKIYRPWWCRWMEVRAVIQYFHCIEKFYIGVRYIGKLLCVEVGCLNFSRILVCCCPSTELRSDWPAMTQFFDASSSAGYLENATYKCLYE